MKNKFVKSSLSVALIALMLPIDAFANFGNPFSEPEEKPLLFADDESDYEIPVKPKPVVANKKIAEESVKFNKSTQLKGNNASLSNTEVELVFESELEPVESTKEKLAKIKRESDEAKRFAKQRELEAKALEAEMAKQEAKKRQEELAVKLEAERLEKQRLEQIRVEELNKARIEKERIENEFKEKERLLAEQKKLEDQVRREKIRAEAERKVREEEDAKLREAALQEARFKLEAEKKAEEALKAEMARKAREEQLKVEAEQKAKVEFLKAEADRKALEQLRAETERREQETLKAEAERKAKEALVAETELKAKLEAQRLGQIQPQPITTGLTAGSTYANRATQSALQKATSKIAIDPAKMPLRNRVLGFTASKDQIEALNSRYKYDASRMSIMPAEVGNIRLLPVARLTGDTIALFATQKEKQLVEEYLSYHPLHAQVFSNYVTRTMTFNEGQTGSFTVDKALMDELTYNFATTPIHSTSLQQAQDQYLYINTRLTDVDQIKFWNWVNTVKTGDEVKVPSWISLSDVMYSQ